MLPLLVNVDYRIKKRQCNYKAARDCEGQTVAPEGNAEGESCTGGLVLFQLQCGGIDAVTLTGRCRAIREDMA